MEQLTVLDKLRAFLSDISNITSDNYIAHLHIFLSTDEINIFGDIFNRKRDLQSDFESTCSIEVLPKCKGKKDLIIKSLRAADNLVNRTDRLTDMTTNRTIVRTAPGSAHGTAYWSAY